jgi:hypothetical protein
MINGAGSVPLTNGSGSGRTKTMRIRIPNTDGYILLGLKGSGAKKVFFSPKNCKTSILLKILDLPFKTILLGRKMLSVPLHFRKKLFVWNYHNSQLNVPLDAVFQIRIRRVCKFLGLPDPHLLVRI